MSERLLEHISAQSKNYKTGHENSLGERFSSWWSFGVIIITYWIIGWISQEFIYSDSFYYRSYSGTLTNQTIESMLGFQSRFWWAGYAVIPVILCLKFSFTALCISIAAIILFIEVRFKEIFKTAILAEAIFVLSQIVYTISLFLNLNDVTVQNAAGFYPLSALSFVGLENVNAQWLVYPLQTLNLFEVFYMVAIAWLLSKKWKPDFVDSLNIVIPSYGLGLLLWMTLVAFLTFQLS